jgi:hypothetical protein
VATTQEQKLRIWKMFWNEYIFGALEKFANFANFGRGTLSGLIHEKANNSGFWNNWKLH